jgi:6-phosphogluconolactonase
VNREVQILPDGAAIASRAAEKIIQAASVAVKQRGAFTISLAGGSTPKALYGLLATDPVFNSQMPWDKTQFFFGDERHVPPDHSESNYRMANESMLSKVPLRPEQVHRVKGEVQDAEKAALEYEQTLRSHFKLAPGQLPRFDVVLLGMGDEGHTLSLFPGTKALHDNGRLVMSNWIGKLYTERVTITAPVANNSGLAMFMVTKADKALALKGVLEGPYEPEQLPSQLIQPKNGELLWLVDTAAGSKLSTGIREERESNNRPPSGHT